MSREAGFTFIVVIAMLSIALILLAVCLPSWRHVIQDDREQELLFRGFQIADAIQTFRTKNGNALPPSLDVLVRGKFLRKAYKDPMTQSGEWRVVHLGELVGPQVAAVGGLTSIVPSPSPSPSQSPSTFGVPAGQTLGPMIGVASRSTAKSIRIFNGHSHYNDWVFAVGQARIIGTTPELTVAQLFGGAPAPAQGPPGSLPGVIGGSVPGQGEGAPAPSPAPSP